VKPKMILSDPDFHKKLKILAANDGISIKVLLEKMYEKYTKEEKLYDYKQK